MENGSFQAPFSEIASLEFREELPPIPQQVPTSTAQQARNKSSTVETLLAQNEDLMARLKVTLRRLNALENQNAELREITDDTRTSNASLSDQLMVWKEKENFWKQKNQSLEEQNQQIHARFPELHNMEERLERYQKYHEKIRTQVKPYIQQLKSYAQNLVLEIRKLNTELEEKEMRRQDLERRVREIRFDVDNELRRQDEHSRRLTEIFEQEKDALKTEILDLRQQNDELEMKSHKLDQALMRQDELENMVIALRRAKEESDTAFAKDARERESELQKTRTEMIENKCRLEDLERKAKASNEESERQRHRADQLQEQLSSLRYLWSNKCEETEKLQASLQSLEKLNLDLSYRLNQARKGEPSL